MDISNQERAFITALENAFGKASNTGFGSTTLYSFPATALAPELQSLDHYKRFLGAKWLDTPDQTNRWLKPWKQVYVRPVGSPADIINELKQLQDADIKPSIGLLIEFPEQVEQAKIALTNAFNDQNIHHLAIYNLGDGEAMSGIMVTGLYSSGLLLSVLAIMD